MTPRKSILALLLQGPRTAKQLLAQQAAMGVRSIDLRPAGLYHMVHIGLVARSGAIHSSRYSLTSAGLTQARGMDEITGRSLGTLGADACEDSVALLTSHYTRKHGRSLLTIDADHRAHVYLPGMPLADQAAQDPAWIVGTWSAGCPDIPNLAADIRDQIEHHLKLAAAAARALRRARARHPQGAQP